MLTFATTLTLTAIAAQRTFGTWIAAYGRGPADVCREIWADHRSALHLCGSLSAVQQPRWVRSRFLLPKMGKKAESTEAQCGIIAKIGQRTKVACELVHDRFPLKTGRK